jgi:hypothetical protein
MMEQGTKTPDKWRAQHRTIRKVGFAALESPEYEALEVMPRYEDTNPYELMAKKRYQEFEKVLAKQDIDKDLRKSLTAGATEIGYSTMGRIIGYAALAYANFCRDRQREPQVEELTGLLSTDKSFDALVTDLATMPNKMNSAVEEAYRLREYEFGWGYDKNNPPYAVTINDSGELSIGPNPVTRQKLIGIDTASRGEKFEMCPAHGVLMRPLWDDMISEAATNPAMFAHDLGLTKAA